MEAVMQYVETDLKSLHNDMKLALIAISQPNPDPAQLAEVRVWLERLTTQLVFQANQDETEQPGL